MLSLLRPLLAILLLSPHLLAGGGANLIPNGNFEDDATIACGFQSQLPAPWRGNSVDTYSHDCTCLPGLDPFFPFQNFAMGFQSYEGCRFVAGWGFASEWFSAPLSVALVPGFTYRLGGAFSRSISHLAGDPYDVYFSTDSVLDRSTDFLAGTIGHNTAQGSWTTDAFEFTAPESYAYVFFDPPAGKDCYLAADDLVLEPLASVTTRNGSGVNPTCYTSSTPGLLGATWMAQVDTLAYSGATLTVLVGFAAPASGLVLNFGELLVDPTSALLLQLSAVPIAGKAAYALALPNDASLEGIGVFTQAVVLGGGLRLCNAIDVQLGY